MISPPKKAPEKVTIDVLTDCLKTIPMGTKVEIWNLFFG